MGDKSLFQQTIERVQGIPSCLAPLVVVGPQYQKEAESQAEEIGAEVCVLAEPASLGTGPALMLGVLSAVARTPDCRILSVHCDNYVADEDSWRTAVVRAAEQDQFSVLCVETGDKLGPYGHAVLEPAEGGQEAVHSAVAFVEKPTQDELDALKNTGNRVVWTIGTYVHRAAALQEKSRAYSASWTDAVGAALGGDGLSNDIWTSAAWDDAVSIEDMLVGDGSDLKCSVLTGGWSDVGTWDMWADCVGRDERGNKVSGEAILENSTGTIVHSTGALTCVAGVEDVVVVNTGDVCMVTPRHEQASDRKAVLKSVRTDKQVLTSESPKVVRPWGNFTTLMRMPGFQVKRLVVSPEQRLSLQRHRHRSEHWVVASGRALVTLDDELIELGVGQSIDVPLGSIHRLENPSSSEQLEVIEVQLGERILETDIERIEDDHGRIQNSE